MITACSSATPDAASTSVAVAPTTVPTVVTTSTTAPTTSTSTVPTTTTLPGDWADLPVVAIVLADGVALGWWDGANWIRVDESTELPLSDVRDFQVALLGATGLVTSGSPNDHACAVSGEPQPGVTFDDLDSLYTYIDDGEGSDRLVFGVGISAGWELTPRPVERGEAHPDLEAVAIDLLGERGMDIERPAIVQVVDVDLDGDGAIESIVVAEETHLANDTSGVYSIVFALSPSWETPRIVDSSVIPESETGFPVSFRVSAVADLSGDGVMEVMLDGMVWEGSGVGVYELTSSGFESRLIGGCGF